MSIDALQLSRARESRAAIERLYIEMRHLLNNGSFRDIGQPGEVITDALMTLRPEIYGALADPHKVELDGLVYVIDRLPKGIEECRFVKLVSEEGYGASQFETLVPAKRRRDCFRIDKDHMYIEVTRGRSDVYDIITHLTFLHSEARKIKQNAQEENERLSVPWQKLKKIVQGEATLNAQNREVALTYLSTIVGQTFEATRRAYERMNKNSDKNNGLFHVVYWLGKLALQEEQNDEKFREISFSPALRARIGHHIYGERWAKNIHTFLKGKGLFQRPIHIVSANLHSVMNSLYAPAALKKKGEKQLGFDELMHELSKVENQDLRKKVSAYAKKNGMYELNANSSAHIAVQIFDTAKIKPLETLAEWTGGTSIPENQMPIIVVMDYAFGEQAYESLDELLKNHEKNDQKMRLPVSSISIMGKAGILEGEKGDIMVPTAHVFEGTADNYPIDNDFDATDFRDYEGKVFEGTMITVLGTSLQNRDILSYFKNSSWAAIGLEMEGAHYQKAIQAHALIRKTIDKGVTIRYAYYASDNPLISGSTLASGSLGDMGIKPTYTITHRILTRIFQSAKQDELKPDSKDTSGNKR